jgi:hypothetical protein
MMRPRKARRCPTGSEPPANTGAFCEGGSLAYGATDNATWANVGDGLAA